MSANLGSKVYCLLHRCNIMNVGKELLLVFTHIPIHVFAQLSLFVSVGFFVVGFFVDANTYGFAFLNVDMSL